MSYALPILDTLQKDKKNGLNQPSKTSPVCIVIADTSELTKQIVYDCRHLARGLDLKIVDIQANISDSVFVALMKQKPHIIVSTTGVLMKHAMGGKF